MARVLAAVLLLLALTGCGDERHSITIATVNNGDMLLMRRLSVAYEKEHPGTVLKWVVLEENVLRQRVTTDIATGVGQFDVVTIGNYEIPIWASRGWLKRIEPPAAYDADDLLPPVRAAASWQGQMYALPFYAESALLYYRKDLFDSAGLDMPPHPAYSTVVDFAKRLNDPGAKQYGICLRGKPGWGENMALVTAMVHAFGGRWFDMRWRPTVDSPEWRRALTVYDTLLKQSGPPGASSNGFNENLVLFSTGHCAMWIDATVAAAILGDPRQSVVAGKVAYASIPTGDDPHAPTWLWTWNLAIPTYSKHAAAAQDFVIWATSKGYIQQVAAARGWAAVPPGTRKSTYQSPSYQSAAPFWHFVLDAISTARLHDATPSTRPYQGAQFVEVPEFQAVATQVGQFVAATLTGGESVESALTASQSAADRIMRQSRGRHLR